MNRAICVNTWREFKSNKVRLILLTLLFLGPLAHFTWRRCFSPLEIQDEMISFSAMSIFFALIWGIGVVGRERQHGTITLVLARPVTITNYIISKWIAVGLAAAICAVQALVVEHAISVYFAPSLLLDGEFFANMAERIIIAFGTASVLVFCSSLVTGIKDLAIIADVLFALMLGAQVLSPVYHTAYTWSGISQVNLERLAHIGFGALAAVFYPNIPIANLFTFGGEYIGSVINYVCVVSVFLSLAVFTLSRKEFSYAQD